MFSPDEKTASGGYVGDGVNYCWMEISSVARRNPVSDS
jgi:hypothetical protein